MKRITAIPLVVLIVFLACGPGEERVPGVETDDGAVEKTAESFQEPGIAFHPRS